MSISGYPGFYSLNNPEPESPAPSDEAMNTYPSVDEAALRDDLMTTLLFEQFLTLSAQYNDLTPPTTGSSPPVVQQINPVEIAPLPTEPVRLKQTHPRVLHACDYCRHRKTKCSGDQPLCASCKKRGRTCTWTPIKVMKNRPSRKHSEPSKSPSSPRMHNTKTRPVQPYIAAQMPTYPNITRTSMHIGSTLLPAMHGQLADTSSSPFESHSPAGWSEVGASNLSQVWIPQLPSHNPSFSSAPSYETLPSANQSPRNDGHPSMTPSFSVNFATKQNVRTGYASRSYVPA